MGEARYEVTTWDIDLQKFTPQVGVRGEGLSKWELRLALRQLRNIGYDVKRNFAPSVLIERIDAAHPPEPQ